MAAIRSTMPCATARSAAMAFNRIADRKLDAENPRTAMRHLKRLHRRIADLFELSKLDAGQVAPRLEPFRLGELLQDVVQDGQLAARERAYAKAWAEIIRASGFQPQ